MKLLPTLLVSLSAVVCLAGEPYTSPVEGPSSSAPTVREDVPTADTTGEAAPAPVPKTKEGEVVAVAPSGLTVKLDGEERTLPLQEKAQTAAKVVFPGDKVRLFYVEEDAQGRPASVSAVAITEPARVSLTDPDAKKKATSKNR